jgi:hypothetical protein
MAFLDRYVYKNPKTKYTPGGNPLADVDVNDELAMGYAIVQGQDPESLRAAAAGLLHGKSAMQPRGPRHGRADVDEPANRKAFAHKDAIHVAPEDLFLHTYFRTKTVSDEGNTKSLDNDLDMEAGDDESVDEFADQLAENLMRSVAGADADIDDEFDEDWSQVSAGETGAGVEALLDESDHDDDGLESDLEEDSVADASAEQHFSDDDDDLDVGELIADEDLEFKAPDVVVRPRSQIPAQSAAKRSRTTVSSIFADADEYDARIHAGEQASASVDHETTTTSASKPLRSKSFSAHELKIAKASARKPYKQSNKS